MKSMLAFLARWVVTALFVVAAVGVSMWLWHRYEDVPWTRDGHVRADVVRVATDVGGLVTQVAVRDNQVVKKGDLLFVVDTPRYTDAYAEANAQVASAQAKLDEARKVSARDVALGDLVATETHEQNVATVRTAEAALASAQAQRQTAALNIHRAEVRASVSGTVTNLDLHPGDFIAAGQQALALFDADSLRVEGYFEETKLHRIHVGDEARIRLMGDETDVIGHVESISGGIADDQTKDTPNRVLAVDPTFSWVRLAQRIPVRIHVDKVPAGALLVVGRTATITILDRQPPQGQHAAQQPVNGQRRKAAAQ